MKDQEEVAANVAEREARITMCEKIIKAFGYPKGNSHKTNRKAANRTEPVAGGLFTRIIHCEPVRTETGMDFYEPETA